MPPAPRYPPDCRSLTSLAHWALADQRRTQGRGDTTAVLNDAVTWLHGRHTFVFGSELRRAYNNNTASTLASLTYTSMANFLADKGNSFTVQLGSGNDRILQPSYDSFAQDSFKLRPISQSTSASATPGTLLHLRLATTSQLRSHDRNPGRRD